MALFISFSSPSSSDRQSIIISRVIDGDTFQTVDGRTVRLANINTPEKGMPSSTDSRDFLASYQNTTLELEILGTDKYQRTLGRLYGPEYVNYELVNNGLSSKFLVDEEELSLFAEAESHAVEQGKGMWIHSPYYGCFDAKINEKEESLLLTNSCPLISAAGWTLKDESRKIFYFPNISLGSISLLSSSGTDTPTVLYWGSTQNVWNDDRDTLYLFDDKSHIVLAHPYGYV